ncbi:MAG: PTS sugar transporter subunit IIB [Gemmatimonadales bacterium]|nr:PTS sugar transporter subunit IIB [Gemmatimonadales bacterium]
MAIVLFRVDDRLVHGQVVIGWGRPMSVDHVVLVDDTVATSPWEQDLYRMAAPDGLRVTFASTVEGIAGLPGWAQAADRTLLLTGDLDTMVALREAHPALVPRINLGGIHHQPGRVEKLPYLYLGPTEVAALERLRHAGASVAAQDLPTAPAVGLDDLL